MKKILFILLFLQFSIGYSQSDEQKLQADFDRYILAHNNADFEAQLNFFPEFLFNEIPREEVLKQLKAGPAENMEYSMRVDSNFTVDTIMMVEGVKYGRISAVSHVNLDFSEYKDEGGGDLAVASAYQLLVMDYGSENVTLDSDAWTIYVRANEPTYAIKEPDNWRFFSLNEETAQHVPQQLKQDNKKN